MFDGFLESLRHILAKLVAGVVTRKCFGYTRDEGLIMWALALPQVASTWRWRSRPTGPRTPTAAA